MRALTPPVISIAGIKASRALSASGRERWLNAFNRFSISVCGSTFKNLQSGSHWADEPVITKLRISAFEGTDLKVLLTSKDIDTLVLFGIITSGVVLSTALEAMDQDYRVLIVRDACADSDFDLHACLLDRLLAKRTDVVTAAEIVHRTQAQ